MILLVLIALLAVLGRWVLTGYSLYETNMRVRVPLTTLGSPQQGERILIFAPHEDDETLGCAGYIQQALAAGADVHLVMMTNGEYPELDVFLFEETIRPSAKAFIKLGYIRQRETLAAMKYLGLSADRVTFLGYPNQYLTEMWGPTHWLPNDPVRSARTRATRSPYSNSMTQHAVYCGQSVLQDVETVLLREKPDVILTLHPNDIHVDHWPTGTFVRYALEELANRGEVFAQKCRVYNYLIHRYDWPAPLGYRPRLAMEPPFSLLVLDQTDWRSLHLTREQTLRKHHAISLYRTQGGDYDLLLRSFARSTELFGILPIGDWDSSRTVPARTVIRDPAADSLSAALNPGADLIEVALGRDDREMLAILTTQGRPSRNVDYHLSFHAGGTKPADRIIVQYNWQAGRMSGMVLDGNTLKRIPPRQLRMTIGENRAIIHAPWPFDKAGTRFFMVRAWTGRRSRSLDNTATMTFKTAK